MKKAIIDFEALTIIATKKSLMKLKKHDEVVKALVKFIAREISDVINYDHVITDVKKFDLPLEHEKKRYDISFLKDGRIFFIQVDSRALTNEEVEEMRRNAEGKK